MKKLNKLVIASAIGALAVANVMGCQNADEATRSKVPAAEAVKTNVQQNPYLSPEAKKAISAANAQQAGIQSNIRSSSTPKAE